METKGVGDYNNWYYPNTKWKIPTLNWCKTNDKYRFDIVKMNSYLEEVLDKYGTEKFPLGGGKTNKKRFAYRGIGLTCRPNATDKLYDALHTYENDGEISIEKFFVNQAVIKKETERFAPITYERNFSERTEACFGYAEEILNRFNSVICKARILELKPKGKIYPHVDFPYYEQIRLHATLRSDDKTIWEVNGEQFQLPADGNFYWFDTGKYHTVTNYGKQSRYVLSINLSIYKDRNGNEINLERDVDEILQSNSL